VCARQKKRRRKSSSDDSLSVCSSVLSARVRARVRVFAFMGKTSSRKILFFGPEKTAAGFNKKKIISITFKEKKKREEGVREAKLDKRERERSCGRAQRMKKKSSLCVFSSFCRPPTAL